MSLYLKHERKWKRSDTIRQIEKNYATRQTCRFLGEYVGGSCYKFKGVYYAVLPAGGIKILDDRKEAP